MWFFGRNKLQFSKRENVAIRLEAIGGQGANSAGKIIAEAAILGEHFTGNHFSSFGSEKRGTPVKSYVRFSTVRKPIRTASAIRTPDLLVIFHEFMMESHPEIFEGVGPHTDVLINSKKNPHEFQFPKGVHPRYVASVPATEIAVKTGSGLNTIMLGAIISFIPEITSEHLGQVIQSFFSKLSPEGKAANQIGFEKGLHSFKVKTAKPDQDRLEPSSVTFPHFGYVNAPVGGVITTPGNSVLKNHEASRKGTAPLLNRNECFHCGQCDLVCPDFCFVWRKNPDVGFGAELLGIDYQYCKGCQKCIEVCPVSALSLGKEEEIPQSEKNISWVKNEKSKN